MIDGFLYHLQDVFIPGYADNDQFALFCQFGRVLITADLAMVDRYNYHQSPVGFHYVTDPKCRQEVGLDASKEFISMFNGYNALPTHLLADDKLDFRTLNYRLQTGVNMGTPRWSQRSYAGIFEMMTNALVFLTPEGSLLDHSTLGDDWRAALMAKTTEFIQDADLPLIPIFA